MSELTPRKYGSEDVFFVQMYKKGFKSLETGAGYIFEDALRDCFVCPRNKMLIQSIFENGAVEFELEIYAYPDDDLDKQSQSFLYDSNFREKLSLDKDFHLSTSEFNFCILRDEQVNEYFFAKGTTFCEAVCNAFSESPRAFGEFTVIVTTDKSAYEAFVEERVP